MLKWFVLVAALLFFPANAGINNPGSAGSAGNTGSAQINIAQSDIQGGVLNAIDSASQLSFLNGASPNQLDANGYPNTTLTGTQEIQYVLSFLDSETGPSTQWTFSWTPGGAAAFFIQDTMNNVNILTPGNCTVPSGLTVTINAGQTCTFTFNWSVLPGQGRLVQFRAAAYAAGSSKMILCRSSDFAAVQAGKFWTPEFLALLQSMNLRTMRFMPVIINAIGALTNWAFRTTPSTFGFFNNNFQPTAWSGGAGTSGQPTQVGDAFTLAPASSSPANWTDGETIQADFSAATSNTTTSPTLTITGHTGAKAIKQLNGNGAFIGMIQAGAAQDYATFFYDKVLDVVLYTQGGMGAQLPIEYQVNLSNTLNVNLWTNIPAMASDAYVTSLGTYALANLNSSLKAYYEYANEMWNYVFSWSTWADNRTTAMGLSGLGANSSWYGLRVRMTMGNLTSIYSGQASRLGRLMCVQTVSPSATVDQLRFQGAGLAPNGTGSGGTGNSVYNTYTGSANYSQTVAAGGLGRPIDFTDAICPVTYWGGMIFTGDNGFTNDDSNALSPFNINNMQTALNDYTGGNPSAAFAILDNDYRQGTYDSQTFTASGTTFTLTGGAANTTTTTSGSATVAVTGGARGIYQNGHAIADTAGNLQASTTISSVNGAYGSYTLTLSKTASGNGATTLIPMEFSVGTPVVFTTTGTLPTGLSLNTPYFVLTISGVTFTVGATAGGSAISVSGGSGTHSVGLVTAGSFPLIAAVCCAWGTNNSTYVGWESIIVSNGYPVTMQAYEGGLGTSAPLLVNCTGMGVTATPLAGGAPTAQGCADQSLALLAAYRNSSFALAIAQAGPNQFVGKDPTAKNFGLMNSTGWTPSWLTLSCGLTQCPWELLPGAIDSTPTQLFSGYQSYRHP